MKKDLFLKMDAEISTELKCIEERFNCTICCKYLAKSFQLACGHIFCNLCVQTIVRDKKSKAKCPNCRAKLNHRAGRVREDIFELGLAFRSLEKVFEEETKRRINLPTAIDTDDSTSGTLSPASQKRESQQEIKRKSQEQEPESKRYPQKEPKISQEENTELGLAKLNSQKNLKRKSQEETTQCEPMDLSLPRKILRAVYRHRTALNFVTPLDLSRRNTEGKSSENDLSQKAILDQQNQSSKEERNGGSSKDDFPKQFDQPDLFATEESSKVNLQKEVNLDESDLFGEDESLNEDLPEKVIPELSNKGESFKDDFSKEVDNEPDLFSEERDGESSKNVTLSKENEVILDELDMFSEEGNVALLKEDLSNNGIPPDLFNAEEEEEESSKINKEAILEQDQSNITDQPDPFSTEGDSELAALSLPVADVNNEENAEDDDDDGPDLLFCTPPVTKQKDRSEPLLELKDNVDVLPAINASPKRKYVFSASRLSSVEKTKLSELCKICDGTISKEYTEDVTHLIIKLEKKRVPLTMKYCFAIADKKWIVVFDWIAECVLQGEMISEESYETSCFPDCDSGPRKSRLTSGKLLQGICCYFPTVLRSSGASMDDCKKLCSRMGATVVRSLYEATSNKGKVMIISEGLQFRHLYQEWYKSKGWISVNWLWILDSLLTYSVMPFAKNYLLTNLDGVANGSS